MIDYLIAGFHKCGSTSLLHYLKNKGHTVRRVEFYFWLDNREFAINLASDGKQLAFIIRDPVERMFSDWEYFKQKGRSVNGVKRTPTIRFLEAIEKYPDIAQASCYDKWMEPFENYDLFKLEEMAKLPDFPWKTKRKEYTKHTPEEYEAALQAIEKAKATPFVGKHPTIKRK